MYYTLRDLLSVFIIITESTIRIYNPTPDGLDSTKDLSKYNFLGYPPWYTWKDRDDTTYRGGKNDRGCVDYSETRYINFMFNYPEYYTCLKWYLLYTTKTKTNGYSYYLHFGYIIGTLITYSETNSKLLLYRGSV